MTFANNGVYVELKHENEPPQLLWFGQKVGPCPSIPLKAELVLDDKTLKILEVLEEIEELKEKIKKMEETKNNIYGSSETQLHDCVKPQSGKSEALAHGEIDKQMKKLYKQINKHYKTINRELVNKIVHRFNKIIDMYYELTFPHISDEEREQSQNEIIVKQILKNKELPEPSNIDTVLTLIDNVFNFVSAYNEDGNWLFHSANLMMWMHNSVYKFDMERKDLYEFNDDNIPSTMKQFFTVSEAEINSILMLKYHEFDHQELMKTINLHIL